MTRKVIKSISSTAESRHGSESGSHTTELMANVNPENVQPNEPMGPQTNPLDDDKRMVLATWNDFSDERKGKEKKKFENRRGRQHKLNINVGLLHENVKFIEPLGRHVSLRSYDLGGIYHPRHEYIGECSCPPRADGHPAVCGFGAIDEPVPRMGDAFFNTDPRKWVGIPLYREPTGTAKWMVGWEGSDGIMIPLRIGQMVLVNMDIREPKNKSTNVQPQDFISVISSIQYMEVKKRDLMMDVDVDSLTLPLKITITVIEPEYTKQFSKKAINQLVLNRAYVNERVKMLCDEEYNELLSRRADEGTKINAERVPDWMFEKEVPDANFFEKSESKLLMKTLH